MTVGAYTQTLALVIWIISLAGCIGAFFYALYTSGKVYQRCNDAMQDAKTAMDEMENPQ